MRFLKILVVCISLVSLVGLVSLTGCESDSDSEPCGFCIVYGDADHWSWVGCNVTVDTSIGEQCLFSDGHTELCVPDCADAGPIPPYYTPWP
jgi:hypothetical protein